MVLGGALLGIHLLKAAEGAKTLDYEVQNVKVHKWSITNPTELELRAVVRYVNPSSVRYTVDSVALSVYYQGARVGDCFTNEPTVIEPKGFSIMEYPVKIKLTTALLGLVPLLRAKKALPAVDVQGFIKVLGIDQRVTAKVNLAEYDPRNLLPTNDKKTTTKTPAPAGSTAKAQQQQQVPAVVPPGGKAPAAPAPLSVPRPVLKDPGPARATAAKPSTAAKAQNVAKKAGNAATKAQQIAKKVRAAGGAKAAAKQAITKPVNEALNPFRKAAKPLPMQTGVQVKKKATTPAKGAKTGKRAGKSK